MVIEISMNKINKNDLNKIKFCFDNGSYFYYYKQQWQHSGGRGCRRWGLTTTRRATRAPTVISARRTTNWRLGVCVRAKRPPPKPSEKPLHRLAAGDLFQYLPFPSSDTKRRIPPCSRSRRRSTRSRIASTEPQPLPAGRPPFPETNGKRRRVIRRLARALQSPACARQPQTRKPRDDTYISSDRHNFKSSRCLSHEFYQYRIEIYRIF